ncbi:Chlorovirus glycoprotein repeat domain-containing protein [Paramecium bursaria Chlorella virus AN69C]|nr:Chlorovirus glycoprotein repeat domain-containing protein [Paramecium bursaria Chlorella virus AN69C]
MNVFSTTGSYKGVMFKMLSSNPLDDDFSFIECDVDNGSTLVPPFSVTGKGNVNSTSSISVIDPTANIIRFRAANSGVIRSNVMTRTLNVIGCHATSDSFLATMLELKTARARSSDFEFIDCSVDNGATSVFKVNGDGNIFGNSANVSNVTATFGNIANVLFNTGNVTASGGNGYFFGNGAFLSGIALALPSVISEDIRGNIIGNYANVANVITGNITTRFGNIANVLFNNGNVTAAGGNGYFFGNGAFLSGIALALPGVISEDIRGNIIGNYANVANVITGNITATFANIANVFFIGGNITASGDITAIGNVSLGSEGVFRGPTNAANNAMLLRGVGGLNTVNQFSIGAPSGQMRFSVPASGVTYYNFLYGTETIGEFGPRGMYSLSYDSSVVVGQVVSNSTTYSGTIFKTEANRNSSTGFNHIACAGSNGNVFRVRGDGTTYGVGAFQTSGADYAEMMEWEDKNPTFEDRRGYPVVLSGNGKIRIASLFDDYNNIIGVVSSNPSMLADTAWDQWEGKYLKDKFGMRLSNTIYYLANISNENEFTRVGPMTTPPQGYFIKTSPEYILNPKYNPNVAYVERNVRPEWDPVGFVGKLRVRHGCLVHPSWKPLKVIDDYADVGNVAAQVTEYLIGVTPNYTLSKKVDDLEQTVNVLKTQIQMLLGNI